ncbi:uncharacterized protein N7473_001608 [Penicillium subrubescens]|uniref:uncharacterized protein n=1 Tax=Penicillium subrubescens TaxID=1316194 RepID=UPI002545453D|nr:uncharacterized protein N7473_001608 [Penicillium subrubescens]KAJ5904692.1 hypothetical protein N7473_001608 [Penicillium subrubescens]
MPTPDSSDKPSDSSADFSRSRCETPITSPPLRAAAYSKERPRSARNKHTVTFNSHIMRPMLSASCRRVRPDSDTERPAKAARLSWKSSHQLPTSSPALNCYITTRRHPCPFISDTTIPELSSPVYQALSDKENDPDLPIHSFRHGSSPPCTPPCTPPPKYAYLARSEQHEHGADLLIYQAKSPTPGRVFNFADFVNVTPSPAQPAWGGRTPGNPGRTPLSTKDTHKRLNFDALVPPSTSSPRLRAKETGLALQLGGEPRP